MANVTAWKRAIIDRIWEGPAHVRSQVGALLNARKVTAEDVSAQAAAHGALAEAMDCEFTMAEIDRVTRNVVEALEKTSRGVA